MPEYTQVGDALRAEKITAKARQVSAPKVIQLSGSHKGSQIVLRDSAFCVIDVPLRALHHRKK